MVVAASHNPPGFEPHAQSVPSGVNPMQGARHAGPTPYRPPNLNHPDRQQQGNWPFFYVQPPQPYMPCQWPMPMSYVPYGGFPGMGYGMVLPPFPPASYVEAPGYILPHNQLHMVDYRRMVSPHLAPTMAYQARRFRYQHTPSGRVMVSSEVQTEPVHADSHQQGRNAVTSTQSSSESGRSTDSSILSSPKSNEGKSTCPKKGCTVLSSRMPVETARVATVQNGGILFEAEEVRIECSGSPSAMKITHSKETTELASNADGELLQCNMGSAEDVVLQCFQPVSFGNDEESEGIKDTSHLEDPCPDFQMVSCPSNGSVSTLDGSIVAPVEPVNSTLVVQGDPSLVKSAQEICGNPKNIHLKILRLPLDLQCLDELRQMEASVWSVESLMPYVPTSEWMMQNSLMTSGDQSLATVMKAPAESNQQLNHLPEDAASCLKPGTVIELDGQNPMTSLESLSPFLPSVSRLADFGNSYYNKLSSNFQKISNPGNWTKGQPEACKDVKIQSGHPVIATQSPNEPKKLKDETSNQRVISGVGLSDQEHCLANLFPDLPLKRKVRMCESCLKHGANVCPGSPSSKACNMRKHKVVDKLKSPLCATCMCNPEKARSYASTIKDNLELNNANNEMSEVSENVNPQKICSKKLFNVQNTYSGKHSEKCPMSCQSKLREQNCSCEDKASRSTLPWHNNCQHGDLNWERREENQAVLAMEKWKETEQNLIGEKSWRGSRQVSDSESTKSGGKMRTRNKPKQCTQSLVHRRDTRY
ncbi:uncharacterized protein buc2l isoform X2 [Silurus meridionalis]|uniref:uncharacterized protein buc2l isoform X2 n=1 Tax=Silurus meridionalis TaxID=175797 RepID=UPI001EEB9A36|nr:uncharacterized protein buc2l isoform X2 [Silurus meridionalis]